MAKKKTAKKPAKAKTAKPAKLAKAPKAPKAASKAQKVAKKAPAAKAAKVAAPKAAKKPAKAIVIAAAKAPKATKALKGKMPAPAAAAPVKALKGKKGKAGDLVEVVIAPSNPILKGKGKEAIALKEGSSAKKRCREAACDHDGLLGGYCRLHYIKNWRRIKRKEAILASGQLNNYVEELVKKYPDKNLDVIRQDLASEKEWAKVVVDLELEANDDDVAGEEEVDAAAEGVRHDRDFDDEDGGF